MALRRMSEMAWADIESLDREEWLPVLPISSLEQHGRHLPVGTDDIILEQAILEMEAGNKLCGKFLLLPVVHYGNSYEHMDFPGTVTLKCSTIVSIMEDVMRSIRIQGFKKLLVLNSHGGNTALFSAYTQEWEWDFGVRVYHVDFFASSFFNDAQPLIETPIHYEVHGGELETSILQYLRPEIVVNSRISARYDVRADLKEHDSGWNSRELSGGNGTIGVASKANAEKGRLLLEYVCRKAETAFDEVYRHTIKC